MTNPDRNTNNPKTARASWRRFAPALLALALAPLGSATAQTSTTPTPDYSGAAVNINAGAATVLAITGAIVLFFIAKWVVSIFRPDSH